MALLTKPSTACRLPSSRSISILPLRLFYLAGMMWHSFISPYMLTLIISTPHHILLSFVFPQPPIRRGRYCAMYGIVWKLTQQNPAITSINSWKIKDTKFHEITPDSTRGKTR
jgi:hypothetical protein